MMDPRIDDCLVPLSAALSRLGVGRTKGYQIIANGELHACKIGGRTFVRASEIARFIENVPRPFMPRLGPRLSDERSPPA
jgi:hypothetical protein